MAKVPITCVHLFIYLFIYVPISCIHLFIYVPISCIHLFIYLCAHLLLTFIYLCAHLLRTFIYLFFIYLFIYFSKQTTFDSHYENTPIQIYRKFHLQKLKIFR